MKCIHYTLLYIVEYEMKKFIFTLYFFLCYNYIKHSNIPLFSMTNSVAAQKECITKKIVSVHNIFSCIYHLQHATVETLCFQKLSFPIDFYRGDHVSLCFQV